jgi:hypothetical protein
MDVRLYCLNCFYQIGAQLDGALELLCNIGALRIEDSYLMPDEGFLQAARENGMAFATSSRLVDSLVATGEIESVFPTGSISWGNTQGELYIHLSQVPIRSLALIRLLRDLGSFLDSEQSTILLRVGEPFSIKLKSAVAHAFKATRSAKAISPEQLARLQETQAKQGAEAEEFVLHLERNRLQGHEQIQFVRRISLTNSSAGYDIESFENMESFMPDRFIEVKSYRGRGRFFLSLGEIEAAREFGERYHLYLVDIERFGLPDYSPDVIRNPSIELFDESCAWTSTAVNFEFVRKDVS